MGVPAGNRGRSRSRQIARDLVNCAGVRRFSSFFLAATGKNREKAANSQQGNSSAKPVNRLSYFESDAGLLNRGMLPGHGKLSSLFRGASAGRALGEKMGVFRRKAGAVRARFFLGFAVQPALALHRSNSESSSGRADYFRWDDAFSMIDLPPGL